MKPFPDKNDVIYIDNDASEKAIKSSYANKSSLYGITKETFLNLAENQGFACASCGDSAVGVEHTLHVDHNHSTNEIRGLLCASCNTALGWLHDDPDRIAKLGQYLHTSGTGIFIAQK